MDIDYTIQKDGPPIDDNNTEANIALCHKWERSNRLSVIFTKIKISVATHGLINQRNDVLALLKAIDE